MKILTVVGARPQFIKHAVVSKALKKHDIQQVVLHTGQHYDSNMNDVFFNEMQIKKPDYTGKVGGLSQSKMVSSVIDLTSEIIEKEKPNIVLIYGDTNTTLGAAIAANKGGINIAHVEAGLRSFDPSMPEENNRILTDHISKFLFCPTDTAMKNLSNEGVAQKDWTICEQVGDVMYDSTLFYSKTLHPTQKIKKLATGDYVLATIHRADNVDNIENLINILNGLNGMPYKTILPIHPRTRIILDKCDQKFSNITFIDPVGYGDILHLIKHSVFVATDSGGLQKEACFLHKMCLILRKNTEWIELVNGGFASLVAQDTSKIIDFAETVYENKPNFDKISSLYGGGNASEKISAILRTHTL